MPDFGHTRDLTPPLRRAGAQNLGEIRIQTPVQQVQIVDDARNLIQPIPSPVILVATFVTAAVGLRPVMVLRCVAPKGTYILAISTGITQFAAYFTAAVAPTGIGPDVALNETNASIFGEVGTNVNTIRQGDTADVGPIFTPGAPSIQQNQDLVVSPILPEPLFVETGRFFVLEGTVTAQNVALAMQWREIL